MSEIADPRYVGNADSSERPRYGIEGLATRLGAQAVTMEMTKKQWGFC